MTIAADACECLRMCACVHACVRVCVCVCVCVYNLSLEMGLSSVMIPGINMNIQTNDLVFSVLF